MSDSEPKRITREKVGQTAVEVAFKPVQPTVSKVAQQGRQLEEDLKNLNEFDELLKKTDSKK